MKKVILLLLMSFLLLTACGDEDLVTDAILLENVQITDVDTESCGKNCTDYVVTTTKDGVKTKYETESDLYESLRVYRTALKKETGSTETSYTITVIEGRNWLLSAVPATKVSLDASKESK